MDRTGEFVQALTSAQSQLYAYICTLLAGSSGSADVLQETNLLLWSKASDFDPARPFLPWALRFAQFQVLAYRKKQIRSRLIFDDAIFDQLASELEASATDNDRRLEALEDCLGRLPPEQRNLIRLRYEQSLTVAQLAQDRDTDSNALAANLYRIRKALAQCIESRLALEGT